MSRRLVTIGACATAGGIQALRNFTTLREVAAAVYPRPELLSRRNVWPTRSQPPAGGA